MEATSCVTLCQIFLLLLSTTHCFSCEINSIYLYFVAICVTIVRVSI